MLLSRFFRADRPRRQSSPRRRQCRRRAIPWDGLLIFLSCCILMMRLLAQIQGGGGIAIANDQAASPALNQSIKSTPSAMVQPPLQTQGTKIVDAQGQPVLLRGVNWFGLETEIHAPHGLWARDYKAMLAQIKGLGYNVIRLPYSVQALRDKTVSGIDFSIGGNKELEGKTPIEVMDAIVTEAGKQGLMIILDSHRLNNQRIPPLWYGDGFTEWDWIRAWAMLAERYKDQPNVIGADLKNEPHGKATWGTGDRKTDWRLAAERAGNAVLNVNPNWLIFVEGIEENVPGQKLKKHWMGGNLEGVKKWPVRLDRANKLVYSPHEYGPKVFAHTWFDATDFPKNMPKIWDTSFAYIVREGIAPIWVGEFGGREVDRTSKSGQWQNAFVEFLSQQRMGFAYWSWNPNSGDTGGILQDDWQQIHADKQTLLNQLVPVAAMNPTVGKIAVTNLKYPIANHATGKASEAKDDQSKTVPKPTESPNPVATPKPNGTIAQLKLKVTLQSEWDTGFCHQVVVENPGKAAVANWKLQFAMAQATIEKTWNGQFQRAGDDRYEVMPPDWGRTIQPNQTVDMGFCAKKTVKEKGLAGNFKIVKISQ